MSNEQPNKDEFAIKEYPNSSRWVLDGKVVGEGNLILTNRRFVFLHRANLTEEHTKEIKELIEEGSTENLIDYSLTLKRKNFQIRLTDTTLVKMGLHTLFPFPRLCLRIFYRDSGAGKEKMKSFTFTIPLVRGFFQLELTTVMSWIWTTRKAMSQEGYID